MLALHLLSEGGEGPNTELQWLLLVGIAIFFLIVFVGWWTSSREQEQAQAGHGAKKSVKKDADNLPQNGGAAKSQKESKVGRKSK